MDISPREVLISHRVTTVSSDPYLVFVVDDFLPAPFYNALKAAYPSYTEFPHGFEDGKRYCTDMGLSELPLTAESKRTWEKFGDAIKSRMFVRDVGQVASRAVYEYCCDSRYLKNWIVLRAHNNRFLNRFVQKPLTRLVKRMGSKRYPFVFNRWEMSSFVRNCFYPPHVDHPIKLVSMILYVPPEGWQTEYGGGTRFYYPRVGKCVESWRRIDDHKTPVDESMRSQFEEDFMAIDMEYKPNRLVGMVKTGLSYHSVPEITAPVGMERQAVVINITG